MSTRQSCGDEAAKETQIAKVQIAQVRSPFPRLHVIMKMWGNKVKTRGEATQTMMMMFYDSQYEGCEIK